MSRRGFALSEWEETVLTLLEDIERRLRSIEASSRRAKPLAAEAGPSHYPPTHLRTADAANFLGLRPQTLRLWRIKAGGPPYIRYGTKGKGTVVYKIADLEDWVDQRRWPHTSAETVGHKPDKD
jgi:hypothetical protein